MQRSSPVRGLALAALLAAPAFMLGACSGSDAPPTPTPAPPAVASAPVDADPALVAVYQRSCASCHSIPATGAPQLGDARAWAPRVAQGREVLVEHTIHGFRAMPPLGLCSDCSEAQFVGLIEYMAGTHLGE